MVGSVLKMTQLLGLTFSFSFVVLRRGNGWQLTGMRDVILISRLSNVR